MRIYVAGAWSEQWTRARPVMDRLRAAGHSITYDWTVPEGTRLNVGLTLNQRRSYALSDLDGVLRADALLLLAPQAPSQGAWVELGVALGKPPKFGIFVSGTTPHCIFAELANYTFGTDVEAVEAIVKWTRSGEWLDGRRT